MIDDLIFGAWLVVAYGWWRVAVEHGWDDIAADWWARLVRPLDDDLPEVLVWVGAIVTIAGVLDRGALAIGLGAFLVVAGWRARRSAQTAETERVLAAIEEIRVDTMTSAELRALRVDLRTAVGSLAVEIDRAIDDILDEPL